jgi:GNAT superfamily N-acetyltransferase
MQRAKDGYLVTDDKSRLDLTTVHRWLSESAYWSLGRTLEQVIESCQQARVYGVLDRSGQQVAFGRVITDDVTFAYICDVFVAEPMRGQGVGRYLLDRILDDLRRRQVPQVVLATRDAHEFYQRAGFGPLANPQRWLELDAPSS